MIPESFKLDLDAEPPKRASGVHAGAPSGSNGLPASAPAAPAAAPAVTEPAPAPTEPAVTEPGDQGP